MAKVKSHMDPNHDDYPDEKIKLSKKEFIELNNELDELITKYKTMLESSSTFNVDKLTIGPEALDMAWKKITAVRALAVNDGETMQESKMRVIKETRFKARLMEEMSVVPLKADESVIIPASGGVSI